jgi:hypothetical protein
MNSMRDQHECPDHHREGECTARKVSVVLGWWLIVRFSHVRHSTSIAPQESIRGKGWLFRGDLPPKKGASREKLGPPS